MNEEVFIRTEADALTQRIADRLGERQKKLDRMAEWDSPAHMVQLRPVVAILAIAACVAVVLLVLPPWQHSVNAWEELGLESPASESFRAATPNMAEIAQLIEAKNYDEAIPKVELALQHSDRELRMLSDAMVAGEDEVLLYEEEAEQLNNYQLRWTYIYLLVQTGRNEEAAAQLKLYLKHKDCPRREDAKVLLRHLKD